MNDMPEATYSVDVLKRFKKMKSLYIIKSDCNPTKSNIYSRSGNYAALRNTADAAALITWSLPGCGVAYTYTYANGATLSVTRKNCATGYYSFGHELGHNFGCNHNPEASTNAMYVE